MNEIGHHSKIYPLCKLRAFKEWDQNVEALEPKPTRVAAIEAGNESFAYLHENYFVTGGIFKNQSIIFDAVTPAWIEFCQQVLGFNAGPQKDNLPFTPGQIRFIRSDFPTPNWWNVSHFFKLDRLLGQPALLEQAILHLLAHHDALRMRFMPEKPTWKQFILHSDTDKLEDSILTTVDLSGKPLKEREIAMMQLAATFQQSLNLTDGPIMRLVIFELGEYKPPYLLVIVHHLLMDAVSSSIFLEDIETACQQLSRGEPVRLPAKTATFKDWASHLHAYSQSTAFAQVQAQWLTLPWNQAGPLPLDYADGRQKNTIGSHEMEVSSLNPEETETLLKELPRQYHAQPFDILLTAFVQSSAQWTGRSHVAVNIVNGGRMLNIPGMEKFDLSRTIGWLAMHQILLLEADKSDHPSNALKSIQTQLHRFSMGYLQDIAEENTHNLPFWANDLRLNYTGRHGQYASNFLRPANLFTGAPINPACHEDYLLANNISVLGKRLTCTWQYSRFCYEKATIKKVAQNFMETLRAIITDCKNTG